MPEQNEENYLDDLLKSIENENQDVSQNIKDANAISNLEASDASDEEMDDPDKLADQLEKLLQEVSASVEDNESPTDLQANDSTVLEPSDIIEKSNDIAETEIAIDAENETKVELAIDAENETKVEPVIDAENETKVESVIDAENESKVESVMTSEIDEDVLSMEIPDDEAEESAGELPEVSSEEPSEEPVPVLENISDFSSLIHNSVQVDESQLSSQEEPKEDKSESIETPNEPVMTENLEKKVISTESDPTETAAIEDNTDTGTVIPAVGDLTKDITNAAGDVVGEAAAVAAMAGEAAVASDALTAGAMSTVAETLGHSALQEAEIVAKAASELGALTDSNGKKKKDSKDKKEKKAKKEKDKKPKKEKQKGIFSVIKDVFFESLEDETPETTKKDSKGKKKAKNGKVADTQNATSVNTNGEHLDEGLDTHSEEGIVDEPKDENERVIKELYGNKDESEHLEENSVPQKGFFAKLKYRLKMLKKKNQEEDKAEQEAEAQEIAEKQEKKEAKKAAAKEKSEQAKQAKAEKAAQAKEKKAAKPKKEKKPKEPPKPGDVLKIKPVSLLFFLLFVSGIILLVYVFNSALHYTYSVQTAQTYYENGDYEKAYDALKEVNLKESDKNLFEQAQSIMYVQVQYDSYLNNIKINHKTDALNSLIKGIQRYDDNYNNANNLGVTDQYDAIKKEIVSGLQSNFKISEAEARALAQLSKDNFTQYYYKIEAYGEAN